MLVSIRASEAFAENLATLQFENKDSKEKENLLSDFGFIGFIFADGNRKLDGEDEGGNLHCGATPYLRIPLEIDAFSLLKCTNHHHGTWLSRIFFGRLS